MHATSDGLSQPLLSCNNGPSNAPQPLGQRGDWGQRRRHGSRLSVGRSVHADALDHARQLLTEMRTSSDLGRPGCCDRWACYARLDARKWKFHRLLLGSLALQATNVVVLALCYPGGVGAWEEVSVLPKLVTVVLQGVQVLVMAVSLVIIGRVVYAGRVSLGKAW